jgi:hypothetical protein
MSDEKKLNEKVKEAEAEAEELELDENDLESVSGGLLGRLGIDICVNPPKSNLGK